jgi:hypothetical protein
VGRQAPVKAAAAAAVVLVGVGVLAVLLVLDLLFVGQLEQVM